MMNAPPTDSLPDALTRIAVAVVERDGSYLVGRRPPGVKLAGYDEFPGGKVEPGESPAEAAMRECLEETGLVVRIMHLWGEPARDAAVAHVEVSFFAATPLDPAQQPRPPFRWVPRAELARLKFPPANDPLLALILAGSSTPAAG